MTTATKDRTEKMTMPVADLLDAMVDIARVTSGRHVKPILGNVLIGDGIVTGTNLEIRIDRQIAAHCEPMLLPADRLLQILRACHESENITLTREKTAVRVKSGRGTWTLPTEDVAEFPTWDAAELKPVCRMPADQFVRAVRAVSYAVDNDSSRYALGSVCLDVERGGNPTFVGTDGRRLSAVETENDQDVDTSLTLVSGHAIRIAAAMAEGSSDSVQIEASAREVVISCSGATVTASVVDGKFPRWRDVFPKSGASDPVVIDRAQLLEATRAAAVVTSEQSKGVDYAFGADSLSLSARSSEYGESRVKCPLEQAGGTDTVRLNPDYVQQYLAGLPRDEEPTVQIVTHGPGGAAILTCGDYRGVIMPLAAD